jgi:hypothetical protein
VLEDLRHFEIGQPRRQLLRRRRGRVALRHF